MGTVQSTIATLVFGIAFLVVGLTVVILAQTGHFEAARPDTWFFWIVAGMGVFMIPFGIKDSRPLPEKQRRQ